MNTLWDSIKKGDKESYIELYDRFYQRLYIYGFKIARNKELVKDCIQEMFLEIWKKRETLKSVNTIQPYLLTYLRRKIYKELKKEETLSSETYIPEEEDASYEELLLINESLEEKRVKLQLELDNLTPTQKNILKMLYYEGMNHDEIAEYTSSSKRTIYNHIHQAFETLKKNINMLMLLISPFL
ncbi:sigma-70 family RNA polymerase sigma factor [Reichenbachiella sp. MALMAid0571]|uniref:RNA polymerase sigma factor n=1 Tax=Reichenbachiella sp. MALMAid0571 TaxID=3143939 RepID=UPI0032E0157D